MDKSENLTGIHAWVVLWKAARAVAALARRHVDSLHLGMSDFAVLEVLLHKGPLPVNVIGTKVFLTSGSVTTAVDRLENRGFVTRCAHAEDRRARIVHLTDAGLALIMPAFEDHAKAMEEAFETLTGEERVVLIRLLKKAGLHAEERLKLKRNETYDHTSKGTVEEHA